MQVFLLSSGAGSELRRPLDVFHPSLRGMATLQWIQRQEHCAPLWQTEFDGAADWANDVPNCGQLIAQDPD